MPIVPHHQPASVVQPSVSTLHLPATLANRVHLRGTGGPSLASRPLSLRHRRLDTPPPQFPAERCTVVALVSSHTAGRFRGLPRERGTRTLSTTSSPTVTSDTLAAVTSKASGTPCPSSSCGRCSPYPSIRSRRPLPPFWLVRSCHPEKPGSSPACPARPESAGSEPYVLPHSLLFPLLQAAVAGRRAPVSFRQVLPASA